MLKNQRSNCNNNIMKVQKYKYYLSHLDLQKDCPIPCLDIIVAIIQVACFVHCIIGIFANYFEVMVSSQISEIIYAKFTNLFLNFFFRINDSNYTILPLRDLFF